MIYQGLFNILTLYLDNLELFYNAIDQYYREKIINTLNFSFTDENSIDQALDNLKLFIHKDLQEMGIEEEEITNKLLDPYTELNMDDYGEITSVYELYQLKLAPVIIEIFLEKIVHYIVDFTPNPVILNLKSRGFLNLEFIVDIKSLKSLLDENPDKKENLKKYIEIREKFVKKLGENKRKIESLEDLKEPKDKLQLLYLIYRIIDFFHIEKRFNFAHIINYIQKNVDEWLITIPLVTLKNPDLYYCGLYLAKNLNIPLDKKKIKQYLMNLYEEAIDEFEAPLVEATDGLYYFLKSTNYMKIWLDEDQVDRLIETDSKYFTSNYLKNLETSQLVIILKMYNLLRKRKIDQNINAIVAELETRISSEGIMQFREGFISSEATYYVLFYYFMSNSLEKLKDYNLLNTIVSRIYRNLEILEFTADMNYDLISELFYSFESLKLYNCIETKEMIIQLAKYLFPSELVDKVLNSTEIVKSNARFRHLKVDKLTGETIY